MQQPGDGLISNIFPICEAVLTFFPFSSVGSATIKISKRLYFTNSSFVPNERQSILLFDVRSKENSNNYFLLNPLFSKYPSKISFLRTNLRTICTYVRVYLRTGKKTRIRKEEEEEEEDAVCLKFVSLLRKHGASKTEAEKTREQPTSGQQLSFPEGSLFVGRI